MGGATGAGLAEHVQAAYTFLAAMGLFTARSVAGLINDIGLLTRKEVLSALKIIADLRH